MPAHCLVSESLPAGVLACQLLCTFYKAIAKFFTADSLEVFCRRAQAYSCFTLPGQVPFPPASRLIPDLLSIHGSCFWPYNNVLPPFERSVSGWVRLPQMRLRVGLLKATVSCLCVRRSRVICLSHVLRVLLADALDHLITYVLITCFAVIFDVVPEGRASTLRCFLAASLQDPCLPRC